MGETTACFNALGNWPDERERFGMAAIGAEKVLLKRFSSTAGSGQDDSTYLGRKK